MEQKYVPNMEMISVFPSSTPHHPSYLLGSPFTSCISHVLWRFDRGYVFQNRIAEPDDRHDCASDNAKNRFVQHDATHENVD